jgi:epoxyqueuosine reductase
MNGLTLHKLQFHLEQEGITEWGVVEASVLTQEAEHLEVWLENGYHADMHWMPRHKEKRINPSLLLSDVQSIVVVVINYFPGWEAGQGKEAKVARYALGKDYHKIIRKKLGRVLKSLQTETPGLQGRPFTDSAPALEKALAVRAGLGWQGKHSLLITKSHGSWVFIGLLFLNMAVEKIKPPTAIVSNHCGTCTACLIACPTDAIVAPTVIDSRKCIAYWTIENSHQQLPEFIEQNQQNWVFGCDICQEVCPWNIKFSSLTELPEFTPRTSLNPPKPEKLLNLNSNEFDREFTNSPIRRTGQIRLQRNLKSALKSVSQQL